MNNVLLIPSNTDLNRGDQALVWESVRLIEDIYGKECVKTNVLATIEGEDASLQTRQSLAKGLGFTSPILDHPGRKSQKRKSDKLRYSGITVLSWGYQAIIDYLKTRPLISRYSIVRNIWASFFCNKTKASLSKFNECDAVFVKGGGFLHSYGSFFDAYLMYYQLYHIRLAIAMGKKVVVLPNSIGPLKNKIAKRMVCNTLKKCSLVFVRENISKAFLDTLNVPCYYSPDLGFYLRPSEKEFSEYLQKKGVPINSKKVVITLRPYRFPNAQDSTMLFEKYLGGIICLIDNIIKKGYHVTLFAHTLGPSSHEDDRLALVEVYNKIDKELIDSVSYIDDIDLNCTEVEKIYSYYDFMVGTRFHSVIFSLNVNVPSIAIAYGGNKSKGIMEVLNNGDYTVDIENVEGDVMVRLFDKIEQNRSEFVYNIDLCKKTIEEQRKVIIDNISHVLF